MGRIQNSLNKIFIGSLVIFSIHGILLCFINKDIQGVESNVIYTVQRVLEDNGNLYSNPEEIPFHVSQYSPMYYVLSDVVISIFSIDPHDSYSLRLLTRMLSIIMLLSSVTLIFRLNKTLGINATLNFTISSLLVCSTFPWYNISRPDVLILFCLAAYLTQFLKYFKSESNKHIIIASIFLACGFFSKFTMGIFIFGHFLLLLILKNFRGIVISAFSLLITAGGIFYILSFLGYGSDYILENVVKGIDNGLNIHNALIYTHGAFLLNFFFISAFLIFLISNGWSQLKTLNLKDPIKVLLFFLVITFSLSSLLGLKAGSSINYFHESAVFIFLICGLCIQRFYRSNEKTPILRVICIHFVIIALYHYSPNTIGMIITSDNDESIEINEFLENNLAKGFFFSEDRGICLDNFDKCALMSTDIHDQTFKRGIYDYSQVKKSFISGDIQYLISKNKPESIYGIDLGKSFRKHQSYGTFSVYEFVERCNVPQSIDSTKKALRTES
ncbi:MAG: glycosyltransferase family 39 protein [Flavobacteriales bacterium]|nr:glycosyltransferase family 39 protein [Flavobacteriales bacterium]